MNVERVELARGRAVEVIRLGRAGGHPVLYFHSPASSGEELIGAADGAAVELGIELLSVVRPSVTDDDPAESFVSTVGVHAALLVDALALAPVSVLAWSGGAPYALAAAIRLDAAVQSVHLVSPVPGPLVGPDAVADQTDRLRQIATTTATSGWVVAPGSLRDYRAVVAPWPFDSGSVTQPVTIWAPDQDEIVPPRLVRHLADQLPEASTVTVEGAHDWVIGNWPQVLQRLAEDAESGRARS